MKKFEILLSRIQEEKFEIKKLKFKIEQINNFTCATLIKAEFNHRNIDWSK